MISKAEAILCASLKAVDERDKLLGYHMPYPVATAIVKHLDEFGYLLIHSDPEPHPLQLSTEQKIDAARKIIETAAPMLKSRYGKTQFEIDKAILGILRLIDTP